MTSGGFSLQSGAPAEYRRPERARTARREDGMDGAEESGKASWPGVYTASTSGQVGCAGLPTTDGLSTTLGSLTLSFSVVNTQDAPSGIVAGEIEGTASTNFADPFTAKYETDRQRYCEHTWGTLTFTGVPA